MVARDESVDIIKRRTDWFKVRTTRGVEGWASYKDMLSVRLADGTLFTFPMGDRAGFTSHTGEIGMFAGDYSGATLISAYGSYSFNSQMAVELSVGPVPRQRLEWNARRHRSHSYIHAGVAVLAVRFAGHGRRASSRRRRSWLRSTAPTRRPTSAAASAITSTRRFFARAEYRSHYVFTSRNDNEKVDEWKLGFAFFF